MGNIEYRVVNLESAYANQPEDTLNGHAAKGFRVIGMNNNIALMMRETYKRQDTSTEDDNLYNVRTVLFEQRSCCD